MLGLATGSTPLSLYAELVRMHREEGLSFANVVTFNLDEYYPIQPADPRSYRHFMQAHLFDHIDIPPANTHVPDGTVPVAGASTRTAASTRRRSRPRAGSTSRSSGSAARATSGSTSPEARGAPARAW